MHGTLGPRVANVALRALSLGSKFLLVFALAKLLPPSEIGLYGLFVAAIAFSILLIGGDYYVYSQRELISSQRDRWSCIIQHQAVATGLLYLVFVPLQLFFFWFGLLPIRLLPWFLLLLVLEHLAQELNRLLVAMKRPIAATWVLFIRMGAWVWPLLLIMSATPAARTLEAVFSFFIIGEFAAITLGTWIIRKEVALWRRWPIDIAWITRGFKVGFLFLGATLCFKALTTADRYVFEFLAGPDLLGAYVLYIGLAMSVQQFIEPAIVAFLYPRVVGAYRKGDLQTFHRLMRELAWSTISFSVALSIVVGLASPIVVRWIGRPVYLEHLHLLWLLLGVPVIYSASLAPHFGLYAYGADRSIAAAHISALAIFFATVSFVAPYAKLEATAYGLLAALTWSAGLKLLRYKQLSKRATNSLSNATPSASDPPLASS